MSDLVPIFYSVGEDAEEYLTETDPDEAIRQHLDGLGVLPVPLLDVLPLPSWTPEQVLFALPKTVTLYGYARGIGRWRTAAHAERCGRSRGRTASSRRTSR